MIAMKNSKFNGWYFKYLDNGKGQGECLKCGKRVDVKSFMQINELKPCKCSVETGENE